jgi:hypothetical protein
MEFFARLPTKKPTANGAIGFEEKVVRAGAKLVPFLI